MRSRGAVCRLPPRALGMLFAVPFYLACDGVIAPLLGLMPTVTRVRWQLDAKDFANHVGVDGHGRTPAFGGSPRRMRLSAAIPIFV